MRSRAGRIVQGGWWLPLDPNTRFGASTSDAIQTRKGTSTFLLGCFAVVAGFRRSPAVRGINFGSGHGGCRSVKADVDKTMILHR